MSKQSVSFMAEDAELEGKPSSLTTNVSNISLTRDDHMNQSLTYFQSSLFATILEDAITELRILRSSIHDAGGGCVGKRTLGFHAWEGWDEQPGSTLAGCNTEMRVSKTMADMIELLGLKFGVEQPAVVDEMDRINPKKLGCVEYKLDKLENDRTFFNRVLTGTYVELCLSRGFNCLLSNNKTVDERDHYRQHLEEDEAKNRTLSRELMKALRQQRNKIKSVTYDNDVIIDNLKTEIEDASLNMEIRSRYTENWQRARTEQHVQTIDDTESGPNQKIEYYKKRSDHEQRVHSEVELLVNIAINETLEKIETWMNKYDKDMEAIDLKIQIRKNEYQDMLAKRIHLEQTIEDHKRLMEQWNTFKDEREKARQYREKMTNAAIVVQAWWRGLLVRKQMGPYRPKKKKGGAKKKK